MFGILIRLALQVVRMVMSQMMQQFNIVQDQAFAPMRKIVEQVTGGVWKGDGANAFVEEVSSLVIPGVGQVMNHIQVMHGNLNHACDVIEQADRQVTGKVNGLAEIFGGIYSG